MVVDDKVTSESELIEVLDSLEMLTVPLVPNVVDALSSVP
jgi:hypothetical protein